MTFSFLRLMLAGLRHHWRLHASLAMAVAVGAAVLTGALIVGDSVTASLRRLSLERLGRIDEALVVDRFFRRELADELQADAHFREYFREAVPVILLQGSVTRPEGTQAALAGGVTVVGCDERFWNLATDSPRPDALRSEEQVVLNETLARELSASVGDEIVLRLPAASQIPSDSFLGKKQDRSRSRRLRVAAIIPAQGLGRFALRPSQQLPRCLFLHMSLLQEMLDKPDKVNAILTAGATPEGGRSPAASRALAQALRPTLDDYGINVRRVRLGDADRTVSEYFNITSDRMMLPSAVVDAAVRAFGDEGAQPVMTYLANVIASGDQQIPYSMVAGVDSTDRLGPLTNEAGAGLALADDEIVLNDWAANDLGVTPGDRITLRFYEPESTHAVLKEHSPPATFKLKAVTALGATPSGSPTMAADPGLTPELAGVTDQKSIDDWDLPFPLVETIRDRDETYWDQWRTTPKAFVSLATARRLWASRFGETTSVRIPAKDGMTAESIAHRLKIAPEALGFAFLPVKRLGLEAAAGTTPFSFLFLGFSFFILAAAVMLIALLFRLAIEHRASEIGLLAAVGLSWSQTRRVLLGEAAVVATVGAVAGLAGGVLFAQLMLVGLGSWWLSAIGTPFLQLDVRPTSLLIGGLATLVIAMLTMVWSLRQMARLPIERLLAGRMVESVAPRRDWRRQNTMAWAVLIAALLLSGTALQLESEMQIAAFFVSAALVLASLLVAGRVRLATGGRADDKPKAFGLLSLALRNVARHPTRSTLTMGLVATASFLIVAVGSFRLAPSEEGTGGFEIVATSTTPIVNSLRTDVGRRELGFSEDASRQLARSDVFALRVTPGDDASCRNLYRPRQPRLLGVPPSLVKRGGFAWADMASDTTSDMAATTQAERDNPWRLVEKPLSDGAIPVVLDKNTAIYSLHLMRGVGETFEIEGAGGERVRLRVVGLLKNSLFQGNLIVSEANLLRCFPETEGHRFFLVDTDVSEPIAVADVRRVLETTLGDYGFDATLARDRLARFLEVQNTYLSTFQSLGTLGLLLGTFGVATTQLRNVLERRGELALMQAAGFRRRRLSALILIENGLLLAGGLAAGLLAALVAVFPHVFLSGADMPWWSLLGLLTVVLMVGLAAGCVAVRVALRTQLLDALREK